MEGRYQIVIPWKENTTLPQDNYEMALRRLEGTEHRLLKKRRSLEPIQTVLSNKLKKKKVKVKWCIYIAPLSQTSQRRFTMINLPPADWKHIQAQMAAASKQSMHAGTRFTDLGRMES